MAYVQRLLTHIDSACAKRGFDPLLFWDWLGTVKYKDDEGTMTRTRASEIEKDLDVILVEYGEWRKS